jgi:ribosomal protein S18 acetylase RimI-like enzyme
MSTLHACTIRAVTPDHIPVWVALGHESDPIVRDLIPDITRFYDGFDQYMEAKIRQGEAFMVVDARTDTCLGIIAFSRTHNRITFLSVFERYPFDEIGSLLLEFAIDQLDTAKAISSTVLDGRHARLHAEQRLYEHYGFTPWGHTVEAGVPAIVMARPPQRAGRNPEPPQP